jgi:hypothetical protein
VVFANPLLIVSRLTVDDFRNLPDSLGIRYFAIGPARVAASKTNNGFWCLPVIEAADVELSKDSVVRRAERWRKARGLHERKAL